MAKFLAPLFLLGLFCLVLLTNFSPHTWLSGWDNLMPELNPQMNIQRSLSAVWQEYQGLGLLGGMGHSTDLIRQLLLYPFSLVLPSNSIRYLWHFFTLLSGMFGVYYLVKKYTPNLLTPLLAASLYLLNFLTVQNYFLPFEPFSTFWGFLPWAIFAYLSYIHQSSFRNLSFFFLVNILLIPSFYVPTMFLVYLLVLFCLFLSTHRHLKIHLQSLLIIFLLNSFWLLPFLYFFRFDSNQPRQAMGNLMSNQETLQQNQYYANLSQFLQFQGYYYGLKQASVPVFDFWIKYNDNSNTKPFLWAISILYLSGFLFSLFNKKKTALDRLNLFLGLLLCQTLLFDTPPFSYLNQFLRKSSLLDQIFRSPFTKFVPIFALSFALSISLSAQKISEALKKLTLLNYLGYLLVFTLNLATIIPIFFGGLFWQGVKPNLPSEYLELIHYFQKQNPQGRIANLPQGSFYGWTTYDFDMVGSGFLWYGIQNPILDRAFDVWNLQNESYYWQLDYALKKQDPSLLQNLISKYNIQYLLYDEHVNFPSENIYEKQNSATKALISKLKLPLLASFNNKLFVYSTSQFTQPYLTQAKNQDTDFFVQQDELFQTQADYYSTPTSYPLPVNQFDQRIASTTAPANLKTYQQIPSSKDTDNEIVLTGNQEENLFGLNFPSASLNQQTVLSFEAKNLTGHTLKISLFDSDKKYKLLDTKIELSNDWKTYYFTIDPVESDSFTNGLVTLFNSPSYNGKNTTNILRHVRLSQSSPLAINTSVPTSTNRIYLAYTKLLTFYYKITIPISQDSKNNILVLPQTYHPGWLAFYFQDNKPVLLSPHLLANSWANAWKLPDSRHPELVSGSTIYIFFWPQLLEYLGFGLIILTFGYFIFSLSRTTPPNS